VGIKEFAEADFKPTEFEERNGMTRILGESGYYQDHISRIPAGSELPERIAILASIASAGISLPFSKLTPSGLFFPVEDIDSGLLVTLLDCWGQHYSIKTGRCFCACVWRARGRQYCV
jgi:hypothetical protein